MADCSLSAFSLINTCYFLSLRSLTLKARKGGPFSTNAIGKSKRLTRFGSVCAYPPMSPFSATPPSSRRNIPLSIATKMSRNPMYTKIFWMRYVLTISCLFFNIYNFHIFSPQRRIESILTQWLRTSRASPSSWRRCVQDKETRILCVAAREPTRRARRGAARPPATRRVASAPCSRVAVAVVGASEALERL